MTIEQVNPFVRYARVQTSHPPKKERSRAYDCRFFYVQRGAGTFYANGCEYRITPHTAICIRPAVSYRFSFKDPENVNIYVLNFDFFTEEDPVRDSLGTATESTFDESRLREQPHPEQMAAVHVVRDAIRLYEHVHACTELFLREPPHFRASASAHLKLALVALLTARQDGTPQERTVREVQAYLREHIADPELTNGAVAERFGYHPYHLGRLFKEHTGCALHEYLLDYRLSVAKNYLAATDLRVTAVAEACGFSSYTYFIKLFRERVGTSPLRYRAVRRRAEGEEAARR